MFSFLQSLAQDWEKLHSTANGSETNEKTHQSIEPLGLIL